MCCGASASQFEWMVNHHYQWCSNIIITIGDGDGYGECDHADWDDDDDGEGQRQRYAERSKCQFE